MEESHTHSHGLSLDETISCGDYLLNATPLVAIEPTQIQINPRKRNSATSTTIHRRGRPSAARRTGKTQRSLVKWRYVSLHNTRRMVNPQWIAASGIRIGQANTRKCSEDA